MIKTINAKTKCDVTHLRGWLPVLNLFLLLMTAVVWLVMDQNLHSGNDVASLSRAVGLRR